MKKNKKYIKIILIIIIISLLIFKLKKDSKKQIFTSFLTQINTIIEEKSNNKTISSDTIFTLKVDTDLSDKTIIPTSDYKGSYQIDFEKGYTNIDLKGKHYDSELNSNIYITNGNLYFKISNTYDEYISYNINNYDIVSKKDDYKKVITTLLTILNKNIKNEYFSFEKTKLNGYEVDKTTLNLSKKNYNKIKNKVIKKLSKDEKFINSVYNLYGYDSKNISEFLDSIDIKKITLYTTRDTKEFIGIKINGEEIDININYKDDKYLYEYYLRDGLIYNGFIGIDNENLTSFSLTDNLNHYIINIDFKSIDIEYNKEINELKEIDNSINFFEVKNQITNKNEILKRIKDNYLDRYKEEVEESKEYFDKSETLPEDWREREN